MNVWYINSILGAICLEEENDALCGVHFCPYDKYNRTQLDL